MNEDFGPEPWNNIVPNIEADPMGTIIPLVMAGVFAIAAHN